MLVEGVLDRASIVTHSPGSNPLRMSSSIPLGIAQQSRNEGHVAGAVEFDKGKYEVEAAMCRDGKEYDLVFDANFNLLGRELDD
jgi:hypothetical protein